MKILNRPPALTTVITEIEDAGINEAALKDSAMLISKGLHGTYLQEPSPCIHILLRGGEWLTIVYKTDTIRNRAYKEMSILLGVKQRRTRQTNAQ